MKAILIISAFPSSEFLGWEMAERYALGAKFSGFSVELLHLYQLEFNPILKNGYKEIMPLEPDLIKAQELIRNADHLVWFYPNWWATFPAILKGFIDRVFLPGFAFKYRKDSLFWDKLLTNKSARIVVTMDTPPWYYNWINGAPGHKTMKKGVLEFCGISPVRITSFGPVKTASNEKIQKWLNQVYELGKLAK